ASPAWAASVSPSGGRRRNRQHGIRGGSANRRQHHEARRTRGHPRTVSAGSGMGPDGGRSEHRYDTPDRKIPRYTDASIRASSRGRREADAATRARFERNRKITPPEPIDSFPDMNIVLDIYS